MTYSQSVANQWFVLQGKDKDGNEKKSRSGHANFQSQGAGGPPMPFLAGFANEYTVYEQINPIGKNQIEIKAQQCV